MLSLIIYLLIGLSIGCSVFIHYTKGGVYVTDISDAVAVIVIATFWPFAIFLYLIYVLLRKLKSISDTENES
jgi:hypothetical protein